MSADLAEKMRCLADSGHDRAHELRDLSNKFEVAARGFYADPQTVEVKAFMGAWARARRLWCECSGDDLIARGAVAAGSNLLAALLKKSDGGV